MSHLDDLWDELFDEDISLLERKLLEGLERRVGSNDTVLLLSSIVVYFFTMVMFRDPRSPFLRLKATGNELEKDLKKLHEYLKIDKNHSYLLGIQLQDLRETVQITKTVLDNARRDAREREDFPLRAYQKMALVAFVASMMGSLVTLIFVTLILLS